MCSLVSMRTTEAIEHLRTAGYTTLADELDDGDVTLSEVVAVLRENGADAMAAQLTASSPAKLTAKAKRGKLTAKQAGDLSAETDPPAGDDETDPPAGDDETDPPAGDDETDPPAGDDETDPPAGDPPPQGPPPAEHNWYTKPRGKKGNAS